MSIRNPRPLNTIILLYRWQKQGKYTVFEAFDEIHAQLASNGNFHPGFLDFFPVGVNNVSRF